MDEVHVDLRQRHRKLLEGIEARLVHAPVILGAPVVDELAQIRQVRAVLPARAGDLVGPADAVQPLAEVSESGVWDPDGEGRRCHDDLLEDVFARSQRSRMRYEDFTAPHSASPLSQPGVWKAGWG